MRIAKRRQSKGIVLALFNVQIEFNHGPDELIGRVNDNTHRFLPFPFDEDEPRWFFALTGLGLLVGAPAFPFSNSVGRLRAARSSLKAWRETAA